ncbi:nucleotidyltransferase family protein [Streptomyces sp. NPDC020898]|uniref:nucleotidyltransferase family protein n=1 Tax=Streptomyces sp. NPDC020898 TaxID=3365101 RepID=UPI0037AB651F
MEDDSTARVVALVCQVSESAADPDAIGLDDELRDLGITSLLLIQLITQLEEEFDLELTEGDLLPSNFHTVSATVRLVEARRNGSSECLAPRQSAAAAAEPTANPLPRVSTLSRWSDLPVEAQLLLSTARLDMAPDHVDLATAILHDRRLDWGAFLDLATRNRVLAVVARNFDRKHLGPLGTVRRSTLRAAYLYNRGRHQATLAEWRSVFALLRERGISAVARKGAYLANHVYPDPALRYMEDLDLYVTDEELPALVEALSDLGYQQGSDSPDRRHVVPLQRETAVFWQLNVAALPPFLRPTSDPYIDVFSIDVRRDLMEPASGKSVPAKAFLARAHTTQIGGEDVLVPGNEDMLLDIAVHLHREATTLSSIHAGKDLVLLRFLDVALWVRHTADVLDWDVLERAIDEHGLAGELYFALHCTDEVFPGVIDTAALARFRPADLDYLDAYGALDGQPARWDDEFLSRLADRHRSARVLGRSALPRPRVQWTDDHGGR